MVDETLHQWNRGLELLLLVSGGFREPVSQSEGLSQNLIVITYMNMRNLAASISLLNHAVPFTSILYTPDVPTQEENS
jgi:hypothetical protein